MTWEALWGTESSSSSLSLPVIRPARAGAGPPSISVLLDRTGRISGADRCHLRCSVQRRDSRGSAARRRNAIGGQPIFNNPNESYEITNPPVGRYIVRVRLFLIRPDRVKRSPGARISCSVGVDPVAETIPQNGSTITVVSDDGGKTSGIGSRYSRLANASMLPATVADGRRPVSAGRVSPG